MLRQIVLSKVKVNELPRPSLQNSDYLFHVLIQFCFQRFVGAFIMMELKFLLLAS